VLQIRPTEVKAIADLLSQEHESVEDLAKLVIETIDGLRAKREMFAIVHLIPSFKLVKVIGLYATQLQAEKDYHKKIQRYDEKDHAYIGKFTDSSVLDLG